MSHHKRAKLSRGLQRERRLERLEASVEPELAVLRKNLRRGLEKRGWRIAEIIEERFNWRVQEREMAYEIWVLESAWSAAPNVALNFFIDPRIESVTDEGDHGRLEAAHAGVSGNPAAEMTLFNDWRERLDPFLDDVDELRTAEPEFEDSFTAELD